MADKLTHDEIAELLRSLEREKPRRAVWLVHPSMRRELQRIRDERRWWVLAWWRVRDWCSETCSQWRERT